MEMEKERLIAALIKENDTLKDLIRHVLATTSYDAMSERTRVKLLKATK